MTYYLDDGWVHANEPGYPDAEDFDDDATRFWAKVDRSGGEQACWPWTAHRNTKGYGRVSRLGVLKLAHRVAYELVVGPIPDGLQLDHLCRNQPCVNPAHLEPVTNQENRRRALPTHCPKGHPYAGDNLAITPRGTRRCRACHRVPPELRRPHRGELNAQKTHCVRGHPFSPENTRVTRRRNGWERVCRACIQVRRTQDEGYPHEEMER